MLLLIKSCFVIVIVFSFSLSLDLKSLEIRFLFFLISFISSNVLLLSKLLGILLASDLYTLKVLLLSSNLIDKIVFPVWLFFNVM